jgi:hypothetical protein
MSSLVSDQSKQERAKHHDPASWTGSHSIVLQQGALIVSATSLTANAHSACSLHDAIIQAKHHGKGEGPWSQSLGM